MFVRAEIPKLVKQFRNYLSPSPRFPQFFYILEPKSTGVVKARIKMADWESDEFMRDWDKTYVSTNVKPGSNRYDSELFGRLQKELQSQPELAGIANALISTVCCAVGRADIVGRFFDDVTNSVSPEESKATFLQIREAITFIYPYLGMPTCIPACYGIIGVLQRKGELYGSTESFRCQTIGDQAVKKGKALRAKIYSGVGNSEIFNLMDKYFTDLFMCSTVVTWGYLVATANERLFKEKESHIIIAATIAALGAVRQTKSHIKATIGIGNSIQSVKTVLAVVGRVAEWAGHRISSFDVDELAKQIQASLNQ